jgi:glycosyltransferase involved in cell wall biosynthesis
MPAYNEETNIAQVVEAWYPLLAGKSAESRLVVADSGSTDRTHQILQKLQKTHPKLVILSDTQKQHGPKLIALYQLAVRDHIDYIFQTDSDNQTRPEEFAGFWEKRDSFDGIFGNRTVRGDGRSRAFVERVVCLLLRLFFGVKVPDANAPFRLMKTSVVAGYIGRLPEDYAIPNIMLTTWFSYYKENILFCPITFEPRHGGTTSVNIPKIMQIGWQSVKDFLRFRKDMRRK